MAEGKTTDMTLGRYRRVYSNVIKGKRINSKSVGAEYLFWRIVAVADDFGNFPADPLELKAEATPIKKGVSVSLIRKWIAELSDDDPLVRLYTVDGTEYGHVLDWLKRQPANRSGRRVKRYPEPVGESGGIRGSNVQLETPHSHSHSHTNPHQTKSGGGLSAEVRAVLHRAHVWEKAFERIPPDTTADLIVRHWIDLLRDPKVTTIQAALVARLESGAKRPTNPTPKELSDAINCRVVVEVDGHDLIGCDTGWNAKGVMLDGEVLVCTADIGKAVLA